MSIAVYLKDTDVLIGTLDRDPADFARAGLYSFATTRAVADARGAGVTLRGPTKRAESTIRWRWDEAKGEPARAVVLEIRDETRH